MLTGEKSPGGVKLNDPNCLTRFKNESYRHFIAKSAFFWLLKKLKHNVVTEWEVPTGVVDIVDKTTMTFYEIEFSHKKKDHTKKREQYRVAGYETIVVNCSKLPQDINKMKKYLEYYVIPD